MFSPGYIGLYGTETEKNQQMSFIEFLDEYLETYIQICYFLYCILF